MKIITAYEILLAINEHFLHHNSVDPHAMFDDTRTFGAVVSQYLERQPKNKSKRQASNVEAGR